MKRNQGTPKTMYQAVVNGVYEYAQENSCLLSGEMLIPAKLVTAIEKHMMDYIRQKFATAVIVHEKDADKLMELLERIEAA